MKNFLISLLIIFSYTFPVSAQLSVLTSDVAKSYILVLSQDDLFKKSVPGRALLQVFEEKKAKLVAEANEIEQKFIAEEKSLTEKRALLEVDDFQILADEFDIKVEKMRKNRADKDKKLQKDLVAWRKNFVQIVLPIIREQMSQFGAVVVLDTKTRGLIYDQKVDVTELVIKRLNEDFLNNPLILEQVIQQD